MPIDNLTKENVETASPKRIAKVASSTLEGLKAITIK